VLDDLIDFTDFYPTFAAVAGVRLGKDDPIDGRSFFPQLNGETGQPREWVLNHYQPYWGRFKGSQYVRNADFKLYRDGSYFHVPQDLTEMQNLKVDQAGALGEQSRQLLKQVFSTLPPAPPVQGGRDYKVRTVYPDWQNIVNPHD